MPGLTNISVTVEFQRSGKTAYVGSTFAGYIGLPTAMKPGGWSVRRNSRFNHGVDLLKPHRRLGEEGRQDDGLMVRGMLEGCATYDDAIVALNTTRVTRPPTTRSPARSRSRARW